MRKLAFLFGLVVIVLLAYLLRTVKHPLIGQIVVSSLLALNMAMLFGVCRKHGR